MKLINRYLMVVMVLILATACSMKELERDIDKKRIDSGAYFNRGFAHYTKGQYDQAISNYSQAIEIDPRLAVVYYYRAVVYYSKREYGKAWEDVQKAQGLGYQVSPEFLKVLRKALE